MGNGLPCNPLSGSARPAHPKKWVSLLSLAPCPPWTFLDPFCGSSKPGLTLLYLTLTFINFITIDLYHIHIYIYISIYCSLVSERLPRRKDFPKDLPKDPNALSPCLAIWKDSGGGGFLKDGAPERFFGGLPKNGTPERLSDICIYIYI